MSDRSVIYWCLSEAGPDGTGLTIPDPGEILSDEELNKYQQMRFPKRRGEWLLGRVTAKRLMRACVPDLSKVEFGLLTVASHASGAPYVTLNGIPLPLNLSISHRQGMAAAAVTLSPEIGLGIDLEWVEERDPSFYSDYFTPVELGLIHEKSTDQTAHIGTLLWSAKEAMLKALGQGLHLDTRSVEVLRIANIPKDGWGKLDIQSSAIAGASWRGYWRQIGNTICTIALMDAPSEPILQRIEISNGPQI